MDKFVEFWAGLWEAEKHTDLQPWMIKIREQLQKKIRDVKNFEVSAQQIGRIIKRRKNWSAPGIDGIQNFWWKKFHGVWEALERTMNKWADQPESTPEWLMLGRTVLLPKIDDLSFEEDYRPITCLNTSYKLFSGLLGGYMRTHAENNEIWDEGQLGATEDVLGTVDQLLVDKCIVDEVREHKRNLAVAFYDYRKAYDRVHHDWMLMVYKWMGVPEKVLGLIRVMLGRWKTRLEVNIGECRAQSRWIDIRCGFLQGDSFSPVGFCLTEVPVMMLLAETRGYKMGPPGARTVKRTHSLFIDDLKVYQENHELLEATNEALVKASEDTGAAYGVKKCAEVVYRRGMMVKGEGLQILTERAQALDPDRDEAYKFLGIEQGQGLDKEKVIKRIKEEMRRRLKTLVQLELYDKNLIKAINCRVIPVATYAMNVCQFTKQELYELDMLVKDTLRANNMLGPQASDQRLYMKRQHGGRGLRCLREIYQETKVRIATYMTLSTNRWMHVAWLREYGREYKSVKSEAEAVLLKCGVDVTFTEREILKNGVCMPSSWKKSWKELKGDLRAGLGKIAETEYRAKTMQSSLWSGRDCREEHEWLTANVTPQKTAGVMNMLEQMVETRAWKEMRGLDASDGKCRLCGKYTETVQHLLSGCEMLAGTEYLRRHNNALMVLAVSWAIKKGLLPEDTAWYRERWKKGHVLEGEDAKLYWDFEHAMRKETTARRPDLVLEEENGKTIKIVDMACPQEPSVDRTIKTKLDKYQQLAFETREKRPGYHVEVVPVVIGCLGGGVVRAKRAVERLLGEEDARAVVTKMQVTVLLEGETIMRKVLSGLAQRVE